MGNKSFEVHYLIRIVLSLSFLGSGSLELFVGILVLGTDFFCQESFELALVLIVTSKQLGNVRRVEIVSLEQEFESSFFTLVQL